jgi:para-nitrobenzyl esterase
VRAADAPAAAPPQIAAPYALATLGPLPVPGYDEDCLTLNVWTPTPSSTERLPVLVWIHGGGFVSGSGSAAWYDGTVMARRGNMVVVSISYRLGALGFLYLPPGVRGEEAVANLGLQDQIAALEWVRENIAAFGGDPDNVTVAGQSGGALSIIALKGVPRAKGLFRRAIVESGSPEMSAVPVDRARYIGEIFLESAGIGADRQALLDLPVDKVLQAQLQTMGRVVMAGGGDARMRPSTLALVFHLVADGSVLPTDPPDAVEGGSMDEGDLLLMCTSEEMRFALAPDEAFWQWDQDAARAAIVASSDDDVRPGILERYFAADPSATPAEALATMLADENCVAPTIRLAERRARLGRPAHVAWFTWRSPAVDGRLGAGHTVELPFVFNNFASWADAPMVSGGDQDEMRGLADSMQDAWIRFCATGDPGGDWLPYELPDRTAMEFGARVGPISDPAGDRRSHWG